MQATDSLDHDHRIIEIVLPPLQLLGQQALLPQGFDRDSAEMAVAFLRTFADAYHHANEELHLFKAMERRGVHRDVGLVFHLLEEHGRGRRHVRAMADSLASAAEGDEEAAKTFADNAIAYVKLFGHHIREEDVELWMLAERVLSADDDARLIESFAEMQVKVLGEGGRERFRAQAQQLAERVGR